MHWSRSTPDMRWKESQPASYTVATPPSSAPILRNSLKIYEKLICNLCFICFIRTKTNLDLYWQSTRDKFTHNPRFRSHAIGPTEA